MFKSFWKFRLSIIWVNFAVIAAFAVIGWGLGSAFGNWKAGFIIAVIVSFPVAMIATTRIVRRQAQKIVKDSPAPTEGGETDMGTEEKQ